MVTRKSVKMVVLAFTIGAACAACASTPSPDQAITEWAGQQLDDYQRDVASDGVVTDAELRAAYDEAAKCVESDGWQVDIRDASSGGLSISVSAGKGQDIDVASAKLGDCSAQWIGPLDTIFQSTRVPQGAEREAQFAEFQDCMTSNGAVVDGMHLGDPQGDMMSGFIAANGPVDTWPVSWSMCIDKYYFVLWPEALGGSDG